MNKTLTVLKRTIETLAVWIVATLALQGVVTLSAEFLQIAGGRPHLPMIVSVGLAVAVWRLASRRPAPESPATSAPLPIERVPSPPESVPAKHSLLEALAEPGSRPAIAGGVPLDELVAESLELQLQLLCQAHALTTAAVLRADHAANLLQLAAIESKRGDLKKGPYPMGGGIVGALLKGQQEIAMAPARPPLCGLPYYQDPSGVGSLLALRIPSFDSKSEDRLDGILCVDRVSTTPWSESERQALRLAARKLGLEAEMTSRLKVMSDEWTAIRQVCLSMNELNRGLGLEAAFNATIRAVRSLVPADFIAISLVQGNSHSTLWVEGLHAEKVLGVDFPLQSGLVGQVLKLNHPLPEGAAYAGGSPIFGEEHGFADFRSLRILPLRKEGEGPIGALTVAARKPGAFSRQLQELLELVAAQVAIKIDLAQAHEKINNLAITDSLTGLANHRAFMHGFDVMLNRAQRRESPLALLLCDVDHFKGINDRYGHPFGDQVLRQVAERIGRNVRVVDLAARYGGEEFVVLLEDSERAGAQMMAERLRKQVEILPLQHNHEQVRVTISVGIAVYPADGEKIDQLIDCADQALYHAKASGRNRSVTWASLQRDRARVRTA